MKTQLIIASFTLASILPAQTLQDALTKTDNERFESAGADFRSLIAKESSKGENYFYYGENYFKKGDIDSANIQYQKGSEVNATNPLNYVGLGKVLWFQGKEADAKAQFFKAATLGANKNAEVMRRTAEAYITSEKNKNCDEAIKLLNEAIKIDPKNPENYILLGDAQLEKNPTDGSGPIKNYQKASELNPKSTKGILREGKLYQRGRNYQLALEKYKAAEAIDANFAPAYREKAELYLLAGQPSKSIENWKKYLELNSNSDSHYRYMLALFNNKQYTEAIAEGENLKKTGYNNYTIERLLGWSYGEMGNKNDTTAYSKGLRSMNAFFDMVKNVPNFRYLPGDYKYKGVLLSKVGKDSLGVLELEKGIALDPVANCELWGDIAKIWSKAKRYQKSIEAYDKKAACPKGLNVQDYFDMGKAYYSPATAKMNEAANMKDAKAKAAKEAEAFPLLIKADSAFSKVTQLNPTWPLGYTWRGRANSLLDMKAEKDVTKTCYEKVVAVVKPEEANTTYKNNIIEAYEYFGYYYVTKKDKAKADEMWNKVKSIDPENAKAKAYFTPPKQTPPKGK